MLNLPFGKEQAGEGTTFFSFLYCGVTTRKCFSSSGLLSSPLHNVPTPSQGDYIKHACEPCSVEGSAPGASWWVGSLPVLCWVPRCRARCPPRIFPSAASCSCCDSSAQSSLVLMLLSSLTGREGGAQAAEISAVPPLLSCSDVAAPSLHSMSGYRHREEQCWLPEQREMHRGAESPHLQL